MHTSNWRDPPDYQRLITSLEARARREDKSPEEVTYDTLLERNGTEIIYFPLSLYNADFNFDFIAEVVNNPVTRLSLSDGGAHCGLVCDASMPTFLFSHWVRDRKRGARMGLEKAVQRQTRDTAEFYGLMDRGTDRSGNEGRRERNRF